MNDPELDPSLAFNLSVKRWVDVRSAETANRYMAAGYVSICTVPVPEYGEILTRMAWTRDEPPPTVRVPIY